MGGFINLLENVGVETFFWRGDPNPPDGVQRRTICGILKELKDWRKKFLFVLGCFAFVFTGGLFIASGFAIIHGASFLALLAYAAAVLIGLMMIFQEMEVWLGIYDDYLNGTLQKTYQSKWGAALGLFISIGNVLAVSFLFAYGLTYVFPSLVNWQYGVVVCSRRCRSGHLLLVVFVRVFFYITFLMDFCANFFC